MKKLLGLLGAIGLVATSSATVVACGPDTTSNNDDTDTTIKGNDATVDYVKDLTFDALKSKVTEANSIDENAEGVTIEVSFYAAGSTLSLDADNNVTGADKIESGFASNLDYTYAVKTTTTTTPEADGDNVEPTTTITLMVGNIHVNPPVISPDFTDDITFKVGGSAAENAQLIGFTDNAANDGNLVVSCEEYSLGDPEEAGSEGSRT
ncbi:hypothetical protein Zmor_012192 [Zophobas morio]|uniref:Uncharacterized protein n=1 Tax=Zophobas morio TaxID=2755281 RepID=A0AA38HHF7_9CUCU|nr:hypothetical protein Zmor_012192 [Zophobas morio]